MAADRLSLRALNRATLDRQLLLRRHAMTAQQAVAHLAGLQAQAPLAPYVGLWTRLAGFAHEDLKTILTERSVLRAHLMRNTVHLVTAADFLAFRPLFQPMIERALAGHFGARLTGVDLAELRHAAAALLAETPLTRAEIGARLSARWPAHDPGSLAYAATHLLQLVQVPPRGLWGSSAQPAWFLAAAWLGAVPAAARPQTGRDATQELVLRYLAAYGPATVADIQAWSGLTRLREVTEGLRGRLRAFTGPDGGELLDVPDAPSPGPFAPDEFPVEYSFGRAPPRFLPEYDNLLLSYADRSRVIPHARRVPLPAGNGAATGTLLVDGFWQADWTITKGKDRAELVIRPFIQLGSPARDAITAEGSRLLEFAAPAAAHDVRFVPEP
ncbi:MAG TPA: winged helix DNA-binding domain-containing protein [Streptosporangiaceae bacterium]|nr:winged helix DNA-binding domain-containing protein [Streptosporangiaceae bacterium]